jgi:hypothetical protein
MSAISTTPPRVSGGRRTNAGITMDSVSWWITRSHSYFADLAGHSNRFRDSKRRKLGARAISWRSSALTKAGRANRWRDGFLRRGLPGRNGGSAKTGWSRNRFNRLASSRSDEDRYSRCRCKSQPPQNQREVKHLHLCDHLSVGDAAVDESTGPSLIGCPLLPKCRCHRRPLNGRRRRGDVSFARMNARAPR